MRDASKISSQAQTEYNKIDLTSLSIMSDLAES